MTIENDLLEIVQKELMIDREKLTPEAQLDSLGIVSIDVASVLFAIEEKFLVRIDASELSDVKTVRDFLDFLRKHIEQSGRS